MTNLAILYQSTYGHTEKVANYVKEGASVEGVKVTLYKVEDVIKNLDLLDSADAIIFGTPTYMGSASAVMKQFMEASSKKWFNLEWAGKIAAGFTNSGQLSGDKLFTLMELSIFAAQHNMVWVNAGLPNSSKEEGHGGKPADINRVGCYLGLMTQSDGADVEKTPSPGDLESAKMFGAHVANAAKRWVKGGK